MVHRFCTKKTKGLWGIMMKAIEIVWTTGKAVLHLDGFFPCSQKNFKKLLKVIKLDQEHQEELLNVLKVYFQNQIVEMDDTYKHCGKRYFVLKQRFSDVKRLVETRKHTNGVYATIEEIHSGRYEIKRLKEAISECEKDAKKCVRNKKKFQKYLEIMQSG